MGLTALTELEQQWHKRARIALDRGETWEPCGDCHRYHPAHHDGACDDADNRLPCLPEDLRS